MLTTHAVGIDLGTTYSCIAYLNEHGEPVSIPNEEGEFSTPSVVLFDEEGPIVGTEALRNALTTPDRVVMNSKRYMGDNRRRWKIGGKLYSPTEIATLILRKLLKDAERLIGSVERAVITVPALFSDAQRQATIDAGLAAGLDHVDVINEPVAASLCYILGSEGLWFTELADAQRILVYDLGGGTFDLSLVHYDRNQVSVVAATGDLKLGGIDFNRALAGHVRKQFMSELGTDPAADPQSLQFLALEVEHAKRSLSSRERAALTCQHDGKRKTYQVTRPQFEQLSAKLLKRTENITRELLKKLGMGWAHVDVVLTTGGSSRMPMVRDMLKSMSGWTLNTSLSPDQSIAHGATYYAGMLLSNSEFVHSIFSEAVSDRLSRMRQQSVNARDLGILVRDPESGKRFPHYLIPANTSLPTSVTQVYGTVMPDQQRVHLQVIESGTIADQEYVRVGECQINDLQPGLPVNSEIEVTIHYDENARVHVSAKESRSGRRATAEIIRTSSVHQSPATADDQSSAETAVVPKHQRPRSLKPEEIGEREFWKIMDRTTD